MRRFTFCPLFIASVAWALPSHENELGASSVKSTPPSGAASSPTNSAPAGNTPEAYPQASPAPSQARPGRSPEWEAMSSEEKKVAAKMLLFWSVSNQEPAAQEVLEDSGISAKTFDGLKSALGSAPLLNGRERRILRQDYSDDQLNTRIRARRKLVKLVEGLQDQSPDFRNLLPEMLTVWGESRNIKGFTDQDDVLQQAKMASIIHVLRNRTQRRLVQLRKKGLPADEHVEKWKMAMARFQFSCFEFYDRNFPNVFLGGTDARAKTWSFEVLPKNDRRALINVAKVIAKMSSGQIKIPAPLGQPNTRHYLTPVLVKYNRKEEKKLRQDWANHPRFRVLKIPSVSPQYLAVVPTWAAQNRLITDPPILLEDTQRSRPTEVKIPVDDFVYFWGVL